AHKARLDLVLNQTSQGKASGLNDAIKVARGEIVVFTDARQRIEPEAVRLLAENFAEPEVGCVSGELMLGEAAKGESSQGLGLYWRIEKLVRELESASGSVVGATGAFYAVRRELLTSVPPGTILDDVYLPRKRCASPVAPPASANRHHPKSSLAERWSATRAAPHRTPRLHPPPSLRPIPVREPAFRCANISPIPGCSRLSRPLRASTHHSRIP